MKNNLYTPPEGKILAINKPENWTSFDVVNKVRRLTRIKKVGHAGTLDPFATGVLLICLGPATKQSSVLMNLNKEYVAEIELGSETDTMDLTGQVISESPVPPLMENQIHNVLLTFTGSIDQEIPAYSAAKFRGKRLYKMARKGLEVPRLSKKVDIHHIDLLDWGENFLKIRISCGRGTYIRTLARDIARSLKTTGHLKTLIRTRIGDFGLEDCLTIEELQAQLKISNANDS